MSDSRGWLLLTDSSFRASWEVPIASADDVCGVTAIGETSFAIIATEEKTTTALGKARCAVFTGSRELLWQIQIPRDGRGELAALGALPDGDLIAVGHYAAKQRDATRLWVVRLAPGGTIVWERLLGPQNEERRGRAIATLSDGSIAVAGDALRANRRGLRVARLAADGAVIWEWSDEAQHEHSEAHGVAGTTDGGLVLVGSTAATGQGPLCARVLRLTGDGNLVWDRIFRSGD
jgi:hypothetical protein